MAEAIRLGPVQVTVFGAGLVLLAVAAVHAVLAMTLAPAIIAALLGVATALASRVAVIAQVASDGVAHSSVGSCGTSGMITVCISATTTPAKASTTTIGVPPRAGRADGSVELNGTRGFRPGEGTCATAST